MDQETYLPAIKSGRAFNGFHRDAGTIVHAVKPLPSNVSSASGWFTKAACGVEPGRRGNGWANSNQSVNCARCLNKLKTTEKWNLQHIKHRQAA